MRKWNVALWNRAVWEAAIAKNAAAVANTHVTATWRTQSVTAPAATTAPSGINWDCIATAETGSDWSMHGSSYSSALGVMNQAVRENASPEVAARILAGTASRAEQIAMAQGIIDKFGISAWAPSTVAKCS